ncbi:MAG: hypothetical protein ACKOHG_05985, partial [Planctomycetia bacterium]
MVCLATLAPAATAADATGFSLLKRYLDSREPALPEGCVLDVELEAKDLLKLVLPAGRAAGASVARQTIPESVRGQRTTLGRVESKR